MSLLMKCINIKDGVYLYTYLLQIIHNTKNASAINMTEYLMQIFATVKHVFL